MTHVVETSNGRLQGRVFAGHAAFLGIPFAKPPVGSLRFRPPEAPEPWSGVRSADTFGPSALQGAIFAPGVSAQGPTSEDCLYLNVYTPAADGRKRPVLFWIHGGAFTVGTAAIPLYDGRHLVERGDVVVVTTNYRLGALGFLHLGDDGKRWGASDNNALGDQIAALRWVRENIERFGGDPDNVTLFGESAGGTSVAYLLVSPSAKGLFHRAIAQSSAGTLTLAGPSKAAATTRAFLGALDLREQDSERLREIPAEALMRAQAVVEQGALSWRGFFPILDPDSLPTHPKDDFGAASPPLIMGANRDEWNLFALGDLANWDKPLDEGDAVASLGQSLARLSDDALLFLIRSYRDSRKARGLPDDNRALVRAIVGDFRFRMASTWWAEAYCVHQPRTYAYLFSYESPALRGALRACHALELAFVFGTLDAPQQDRFAGKGEGVERLSRTMMDYWLGFAKDGAPLFDGAPSWAAYDLGDRATMVFDRESRPERAPFDEERRAWAAVRAG